MTNADARSSGAVDELALTARLVRRAVREAMHQRDRTPSVADVPPALDDAAAEANFRRLGLDLERPIPGRVGIYAPVEGLGRVLVGRVLPATGMSGVGSVVSIHGDLLRIGSRLPARDVDLVAAWRLPDGARAFPSIQAAAAAVADPHYWPGYGRGWGATTAGSSTWCTRTFTPASVPGEVLDFKSALSGERSGAGSVDHRTTPPVRPTARTSATPRALHP